MNLIRILMVAFSLMTISVIQLQSQSIDVLKAEYQKALESNDKNNAIQLLNRLATRQWEERQIHDAIQSFEKLIDLARQHGNRNAIRMAHLNLAMIFLDSGEYQNAESHLKENLKVNRELGDKAGMAAALANLATAQLNQKKYDQAVNSAENALEYAKELNNLSLIRTCYGLLAEIYQKAGNNEKQVEYFNLFASVDKHLKQQEISQVKQEKQQVEVQKSIKEKELAEKEQRLEQTEATLKQVEQLTKEQQLQIELEKKERQRVEEQASAELRRQVLIRNFIMLFFGIVLIFSILLIGQIRKTKRANQLLEVKNNEIQKQKEEIEKQAEKIKASIQYARRIQSAVLPPQSYIEKLLPDSFVFFRPRDIVSGDFYWVSEKGEKIILAVADCTGHGVPGAFMSMLGTAFLNEIINKIVENRHISELQAGEILTELRRYVINSLHQKGELDEAKDGMDIVLVIIDQKNRRLQYSGANNPLFLVRDKTVEVFQADPMPIAYQKEMTDRFTTVEIEYQPNDTIYLCTDGYVDQFGGQQGRKFMVKRFRQLLVEINQMTMRKQAEVLQKTIEAWRGNHFQVDDILILGVRLIPSVPQREIKLELDWSDKTILIADDIESNYLYMTEALRRTGVAILHARTGDEAINLLSENKVDLILMDLNMPGKDGFEATRIIRAQNPTIPIIAQTAMKVENVENRCKAVGFTDFIQKPVKLQFFLEVIQKHLT